ncbi:MAG: FAD-dependent oxidoreductase, partial [Nocardioidaceae bacterium]
MTSAPVDVVVIGAGAVGTSVAYELALAGASVRVVEQGTRAAGGCSRANAGLLAPSHSEPLTGAGNIRTGLGELLRGDGAFRIRPSMSLVPWLFRFAAASSTRRVHATTRVLRDLGSMSLRRHADYVEAGVPTSFERRGLLDVFATDEQRELARVSLASNPLDLAYDVLTPADVRTLVPGIADVAGGIFFRDEAHCDSRVFVETTLAAAQALGVRVTLGGRVCAILHAGGALDAVKGVRNTQHFIGGGAAALVQDSNGKPWNGDYVFSSGDLIEDLTHSFFLETGARNNKLKVYEMVEHPAARALTGYLLCRGGVHQVAYARAIEKLT